MTRRSRIYALTCTRIKVCNFKVGLQKFDGWNETRPLDAVFVEIIRMPAGKFTVNDEPGTSGETD